MKTKKTYDSRCYDLAEVFLEDEAGTVSTNQCEQLAAHIQTAIEDWLEENRSPSILSEAVPTEETQKAK